MFPSHRQTAHFHGCQPAPAGPAFSGPATALTLPAIDAAIPGAFAIHSRSEALMEVALTLADAGVLTAEHWDNNLRSSVAAVFQNLAARLLPQPLADYTLLVVEDTVAADLEYDSSHGYHQEHKLPVSNDRRVRSPKISALVFTFNNEAIVHRVIGPSIKRLEKHRPGLGQTIFYWLHQGFSESARSVDPITGYDWAQMTYWGGEMDEEMRLEDELDFMRANHVEEQKKLPAAQRTAFDEVAAKKQIGIFSKADYDAAIPPEFGTRFRHKPKLTLKQLKRELRATRRPWLRAVLTGALAIAALVPGRRHKSEINDIGRFEKCRWDMTPYLLRWHCTPDRKSQDPLAQLYDDYMNDSMQSGEDMLDVNAVFAWHDKKTLISAVQRFETYCRMLHAAEQLLSTIAPKDT